MAEVITDVRTEVKTEKFVEQVTVRCPPGSCPGNSLSCKKDGNILCMKMQVQTTSGAFTLCLDEESWEKFKTDIEKMLGW